jgi:hypothetical protein
MILMVTSETANPGEGAMHPDEVVDLALHDLREHMPGHHGAAAPAHSLSARAPGFFASLWSRYLEGWSWYVRAGFAPPAADAFPLARERSASPDRRRAVALEHGRKAPAAALAGGELCVDC